MRATVIFLLIVFLGAGRGFGQRKLIDKFLSNASDTSRNTSFIALPAAAYAQETGLELGAISITSFYTDKKDTLTRSSTINTVVTFTTKSQSNFSLKPDIWTPGNRYHIAGEIRYKNFPFDFFGTGGDTWENDKDRITQKLFKLNAEVEKRLTGHFYGGLNAGFENYRYSDKEPGGIFEQGNYRDKDGGKVSFFGLSLIYDSRNTNTYTTKGSYFKVNYSFAPELFGAENFSGSLIKTDLRNFIPLTDKAVLGFQGTFQTLQGQSRPFYLLPQLGNDQIMRGYYTGRYRDQNLLTAHAEIRYRFIQRLGVAAFAGTGTVFSNKHFKASDLKPNYGAGIRYFVDPARGLTFRIDYAVGEKRPGEKRQTGFYLALAEAF